MNENRPSKKQRELLSFIDGFIKGNGYGPSYREVMRALDYKSVSTVAVHVDGLIARGFLIKKDHSARSLEVVRDVHDVPAQQSATPATAHEAWLVDAIKTKLAALERSEDTATYDDVATVIEALRVLGMEKTHQTLRAQLDSYQKKQ